MSRKRHIDDSHEGWGKDSQGAVAESTESRRNPRKAETSLGGVGGVRVAGEEALGA